MSRLCIFVRLPNQTVTECEQELKLEVFNCIQTKFDNPRLQVEMFRKLFSNDCMRSLSYVFAGAKCNATRPISSQMYPTKFKGYSTIYALSSGSLTFHIFHYTSSNSKKNAILTLSVIYLGVCIWTNAWKTIAFYLFEPL